MTANFADRISEGFPIVTSCNGLMGSVAAAFAGTLDVTAPSKPQSHKHTNARARALQKSHRHLNFPLNSQANIGPLDVRSRAVRQFCNKLAQLNYFNLIFCHTMFLLSGFARFFAETAPGCHTTTTIRPYRVVRRRWLRMEKRGFDEN
jgi:hypothetical protein